MSERRITKRAFKLGMGKAIRTFREAEGMEPADLAELAELDIGELDAIEQGEFLDLSAWDFERLAAPLRIRASQIMALGEKFGDRKGGNE